MNWRFFGSDEIKVTPRLTVTLGMRWQPDLHFTEASGKKFLPRPAILHLSGTPLGLLFRAIPNSVNVLNPNWHNVMPRVGSYDLF